MKCERSATYAKVSKALACPQDARAVVLVKARGEVVATLCSDHIRAYRNSGIEVRS